MTIAVSVNAFGQTKDSLKLDQPSQPKSKKNVTKTNILFGPLFNTFHVIQEVKLHKRITMQTDVKARPASGLPKQLANSFEIEGQTTNPFADAKVSSFGNVTEFRIYGKEKGALKGFYFGPYFTYTQYKLETPSYPGVFKDENKVEYTADIKQVLKLSTAGGGLQIGIQGLIKNIVAIDWTILGVGFCSATLSGGIEASNTSGNFDFRNYTEDIKDATFLMERFLPLRKTVEKESIELKAKAGIIHLRTGLSIGIAY
jgi:hypothetical protein